MLNATQQVGAVCSHEKRRPVDGVTLPQETTEDCSDALCGVCQKPYVVETEEIEDWIECENCEVWFHFVCVGVKEEPEHFLCRGCS